MEVINIMSIVFEIVKPIKEEDAMTCRTDMLYSYQLRKYKDVADMLEFSIDERLGIKYASVEVVAYAQGMFLRRSFLMKKEPFYACASKEKMLKFFRKYGKIPHDKRRYTYGFIKCGYLERQFNDHRLVDTVQYLESKFTDGCIFIASY